MEKDSEITAQTPDNSSVRNYLFYGLSIPERTIRSTAAMIGGLVNESAGLLVPQAFRDSKSYQTFVQQMLDVVINDVGGVKSEKECDEEANVEDFVARKTVGGFVDMAGMATLHVSPVFLLAIVTDIAYGSKTYLNELSEQLKKEGVIDEDSTISNAADLLDAIGEASNETANAFDTPPISLEGLRATLDETTDNLAKIDPSKILPKSEIDKFWAEMQSISKDQDVNLIHLSSAITMYTLNQVETVSQGALTTITVAGSLMDKHVLQHYWNGLDEISERGIYTIISESSQPYIAAIWHNFDSDRETVTEDIVSGKIAGKVWSGIKGLFGNESPTNLKAAPTNPDDQESEL